jgi:CHASE2 domain-containing sensor protein
MANNFPQVEKHGPLKHLVVGLLVVAFLIFAMLQVEATRLGRWSNARGYEFLHSFLATYNPKEDLPVVVLDISDLERAPDGTTPTDRLREIVEALIESRAKAIAIDIDFSPRLDAQHVLQTGPRSETDEEFFEFLHEQKKKGVPVFVGAYNIGVESKTWLGTEENQDLAADMTLFGENSDSTEVRAWLQCPDNPRLNSISKALADASGAHPPPPWWLRAVLVNYEDEQHLKPSPENNKNNRQVLCQRAYTLVNYGKLELIQKLTLQTLDRKAIVEARNGKGQSKFQDKLVIVGNGQRDKATDSFVVIGRDEPDEGVFGVYVHAIAAYTLVADPVYRFKHWFTILLDGLLGALVVVGLFVVRRRRPAGGSFSLHTWESIFIFTSIVIVLLLGFILVKAYNILWLDFALVILALLLHSKVQDGMAYSLKRLFRRDQIRARRGNSEV